MNFQALFTLAFVASTVITTPVSMSDKHGTMFDVPTFKIRAHTATMTTNNRVVPTVL